MASKHTFRGAAACRRGFTIIECLIGLAISAVLLAAVATAFNASLSSYRENERMYGAINGARQALMRMTSEIRTAGYFDETTYTWYGVAHTAAPSNQCNLYTPTTHELIRYEFRNAEKRLYLVKPATNESYVLCNNVQNATFTTTSENGMDATSVQISLTVSEGGFERTLSAAAVVRRIPPL
jgi:prepilin-type N-terminal cleavage/methylation domain-containing protein